MRYRTLWWPFMTDAGRATWIAMQDPSAWVCSEHTIEHKPSNLCLWVANGRAYIKPYRPEQSVFNVADKCAVWKQYRLMANRGFAAKMYASLLGE